MTDQPTWGQRNKETKKQRKKRKQARNKKKKEKGKKAIIWQATSIWSKGGKREAIQRKPINKT